MEDLTQFEDTILELDIMRKRKRKQECDLKMTKTRIKNLNEKHIPQNARAAYNASLSRIFCLKFPKLISNAKIEMNGSEFICITMKTTDGYTIERFDYSKDLRFWLTDDLNIIYTGKSFSWEKAPEFKQTFGHLKNEIEKLHAHDPWEYVKLEYSILQEDPETYLREYIAQRRKKENK